jgi:transposase-like protein
MESNDREQRVNMKFCFKLGKSATETHEMLVEVYGDAAVTHKTVYKWSERFRSDSESIDDEDRRKHFESERNDSVKQKINHSRNSR